jgi:hypothetical protein
MVTYTETVDVDFLVKIQILNETLSKHTLNYDILCIVNYPNQTIQSYNLEKKDNLFILTLHTLSISHGVFFLEEKDNSFLDNIINSHFLFDIQNIYGVSSLEI